MIFVETEEFTRNLRGIGIPDEIYRLFQIEMIENPAQGDLIQGSGGLRKTRMRLPHRGKSGSVRVWYLWLDSVLIIVLITAYTKGRTENLSEAQKAGFKKFAKALKDHYGCRA
jgi:hypothetical protein